jgi:hypothetical protein
MQEEAEKRATRHAAGFPGDWLQIAESHRSSRTVAIQIARLRRALRRTMMNCPAPVPSLFVV